MPLPFNPYAPLAGTPTQLGQIAAQRGNYIMPGPAAPNYQYHPGGMTPGGVHADYMQSMSRLAGGEDPRKVWADYGKFHGSGGGRGFFGNLFHNVGAATSAPFTGAKTLATQAPGQLYGGVKDWGSHFFGTPQGRLQLAMVAAAGAAGGAFSGAGAGAAGAGAGTGAAAGTGAVGGPLGALGPVSGTGAGVGFGSLAGTTAGTAGIAAAGSGGAGGLSVPAGYGTGAGTIGAVAPYETAGGAAAAPGFWGGQVGGNIINTGANLFSGFLQNLAIQKAQGASQAAIEKRIKQALATLSPEHIMALAQQFLPQMATNAFGAGQTAIQAVREQAARTGQLEEPRALSFEAGTRAKLASDVQQRAFEAAMNTAGGQASAITGAPYTPIQPQTGYADAVLASINQGYQNKFYQQANQQNQAGVPYRYPYNPYPQWPAMGGR